MRGALAKLQGVGRAFLLAIVRTVFPREAGPGMGVDSRAVRSILVVRTDERVGNLLLTTPLLTVLRERLPGARVGLLCAARLAGVVEGTGLYDELWRFEKRDLFRRPWRFLALCLRLRGRYEVAIEAGHWHAFSFTAGMLVRWSGAPVRIGHRRGDAARLLTHAVEKDPAVVHDARAKIELLAPLGIAGVALPLPRTGLGIAQAERFAGLFGAEKPVVLVNPGGRKADHRASPALIGWAVRALMERREAAVWVAWGPGEESLARAVVGAVGGARMLPPTTLDELAGALRAAAVFVTHDSGPMHLAAAVGRPMVAVLLQEDGERWIWPGTRAVRIRGLPDGDAAAAISEAAGELLDEVARGRIAAGAASAAKLA